MPKIIDGNYLRKVQEQKSIYFYQE